MRLTNLSVLGIDEQYTVGTARTIDGRSRGILQHGEALNVLRSDIIEVTLETVHQHECTGTGTKGGHTTNPEFRHVLARLTGDLTGEHTRDHTGERVGETSGRSTQILGVHRGHGSGEGNLFLHTGTGDDHFVDNILLEFL